jgi:hypothetical protein
MWHQSRQYKNDNGEITARVWQRQRLGRHVARERVDSRRVKERILTHKTHSGRRKVKCVKGESRIRQQQRKHRIADAAADVQHGAIATRRVAKLCPFVFDPVSVFEKVCFVRVVKRRPPLPCM